MHSTAHPQFVAADMTGGIGLKSGHYEDVLRLYAENTQPEGLWFEVHTENYFVSGGPRLDYLQAFRELAPITFHGVGASLGGEALPNKEHLKQVRDLVKRFEPTLVSEHAVWSQAGNHYFADLLPLPRTQQYLTQLINGIDAYQSGIGRTILIENPTNYLEFKSDMDEPEFLVEAALKTGAEILLDVNNLYLTSQNCGIDAIDYINRIPKDLIGEIHIAGFSLDPSLGKQLLIDSHDEKVSNDVWNLLEATLNRFGQTPVLLERDGNIPPLIELLQERNRAHQLLQATQPEQLNRRIA
ncbi:DUF692 domain-containing protein [Reinekea marinisedimentorum]|uniref:Uncharacterized protein n=1 Tax=Reinekea marinisedimentorum TaxID=230495 RepID=A0A4R3I6W6_9GAMM|nr:DUF692 domain-containing protein [Reinekea marinisedimentorum]TCS41010.1 hypothetical protein BCF53_10723 [Reinekea marinisedimentorum]